MHNQAEDFFVELAQVCKKYRTSSSGSLSFCFTKGDIVIGQYRIKEQWINKDGEACIVVKDEKTNSHQEIWSNGDKCCHAGYRNG